jgi:hypothetical protein
MKIAIGLFAAWTAVSFGSPAWAQDRDGLNHTLREALYTEQTAFVATLKLAELTGDVLLRTVNGLFDPASLAIVNKEQKDLAKQVLGQTASYTTLASTLVGVKIASATLVGLDYNGRRVFAALPLPEDLRGDAFTLAKSGLEAYFRATSLDVQLKDFDDQFLVHKAGAGLPEPRLGYSANVEQAVLSALGQSRGTPSVSAVVPTSAAVRALLLSSPGAANDFAKAIGEADYVGGYAITGDRPELHLYARFSGEAKAKSVKEIYESSWNKQMADAKAADLQHEQDIKEGKIHTVWYINNEEMFGRIRAGAPVTVFGNIVQLKLDTTSIHQITGALVDGYVRKP